MVDVTLRAELIARGAAQWRDKRSDVRDGARRALRESEWSAAVVEAALDDVLFDLDEARARSLAVDRPNEDPRPVLVILPGNIIGPTVASAFCAAAAGANVILKSPGGERALAPILAAQFDALGEPLAGIIDARYWKGGDPEIETALFASVRRIVAFGTDDAIAEIEQRARGMVRGYGTSYSMGFVAAGADIADAARRAARDVAMFDQRGCMSPQTIYVEGDEGRALLFARALGSALQDAHAALPRGRLATGEAAAVAASVRRLSVTAIAPKTHGLDTLVLGPEVEGVPAFVVAVEPYGPPSIEGFGRIVSVKPCAGTASLVEAARASTTRLETLGVAGELAPDARERLGHKTFSRICLLGEMQRPPFGYRPTVEDFA